MGDDQNDQSEMNLFRWPHQTSCCHKIYSKYPAERLTNKTNLILFPFGTKTSDISHFLNKAFTFRIFEDQYA